MRRETRHTYTQGLGVLLALLAIGSVAFRWCMREMHSEEQRALAEKMQKIERQISDREAERAQEERAVAHAQRLPKPSAGAETEPIATGQAMPAAIATDKGNVYWLNLKSGEVMVRARKGGEPKVLAREQKLVHQRHAPTLVATDGTAYYLTQTTLNRVSAAGGEPEVLLGGLSSPTALLLDGKTLFFCQSASAADAGADAGSAGGLYQLAPRAKAAKLVAKLERPTAIAVDASQAYVVDASSVVRVRKTGGEPTVLASSTGQLGTTLAVDQHSVYYTLPSDDSVMQAQKRDGSSAVVAMERERPVALALSGTALYSLTETTPRALGELGTVWRAATDTAGQPEALVIDEPGLNGLAVAEGDVYYTKWDESAEDGQVVYVNVTTHTSRDAGTVAASAPKK